ncbi:unnamed protein product [Orchesella dallaii]|uniref:SANT domain-containing protein n=1 Tax=Orchesella dallaii TaxID=48710 RepID=A0ABP1QK96_9HEXA
MENETRIMEVAEIPDLRDDKVEYMKKEDPAQCLWRPCEEYDEEDVQEILKLAKGLKKSVEHALQIFYENSSTPSTAVPITKIQVGNEMSDDWTRKERKKFRKLFQKYGKNFPRYLERLPSKTMGSILKHYYSWKGNGGRDNKFYKYQKDIRWILRKQLKVHGIRLWQHAVKAKH